ncbi:MAG: Z1 domain-containing protein, partial [Opitutales bacterium]
MLLGKVQSGKTRTFITILTLAFDNSFDVAIILTKNSTALVQQTHQRIEKEFQTFIDDDLLDAYDIISMPSQLTAYELSKKLVIVSKKETRNLDRLHRLFLDSAPELQQKGVLIIDDEADYASIGFKRRHGEVEANTIPKKISELRNVVERCGFLQVTATPYSLYLQPTAAEVPNVLEFKPTRPAFTKLVPVPDAYVGGSFYFGPEARQDEPCLQNQLRHIVTEHEMSILRREDGRRLKLTEILTSPAIPALRRAFFNFLVGGSIRRMQVRREGKPVNRAKFSFLFHTEMQKSAHEWQERLINTLVARSQEAVVQNDPVVEELIRGSYGDLAVSVNLKGDYLPDLPEVVEAVKQSLANGEVMITKVNSDEEVVAMLDRTGQLKLRCPFNIFIGGQVLDRGVTLSNLIGFFYGRSPRRFQQDTVLQHSRMFGYRPLSDIAVTRFYTLNPILRTLFDIEDFDSALREAIERGGDQAVQFIRQDPRGRIIPCSPNKLLLSHTRTLRPHRRILPIGFQTGYKTHIAGIVQQIDQHLDRLNQPADADQPYLVPVADALQILQNIEQTMEFLEEGYDFDWNSSRTALRFLSQQQSDPQERGKVWLLVRKGRQIARRAAPGSHAEFVETPETAQTEGALARATAINHPLLMLLRQEGEKD